MTNKKFIAVLVALCVIIALGVAAIFITNPIGGVEFGAGKSVVVSFDYIDETELAAFEQKMDSIFVKEELMPLSTRYITNTVGDCKGIVYDFGGLTDAQIAKITALSSETEVTAITVGNNNGSDGKQSLLWGGVSLAIAAVLFLLVILAASGELGRLKFTVSAKLVLVMNILVTIATALVLAFFGIKFTVGSVSAVLIVACFSMILTAFIFLRIKQAYEVNRNDYLAPVFNEIRKPYLFVCIALLVALIAVSASLSAYLLSVAVPCFVGILFATLTNLYVLMPMYAKMLNK